MQRLYHIFRAFGMRAFISTLTGGVFRPIFNKIRKQYFDGNFPGNSNVVVQDLVVKDMLVEVEVIEVLG